jgi:hypothetical protein
MTLIFDSIKVKIPQPILVLANFINETTYPVLISLVEMT